MKLNSRIFTRRNRSGRLLVRPIPVILCLMVLFKQVELSKKSSLLFLIDNDILDNINNEECRLLKQINRTDSKNCPLCAVKSNIQPGDSTTRDAAVCFAFKRIHSLVPFLKTFRSVSNATFVIILDKEAWSNLNTELINLIYNCGGLIINLDFVVQTPLLDDKTLYRTKIGAYAAFIQKYHKYFDRILCFDLEDTIFQADPFRNDVYDTWNNVNLFKEDLLIKDSPSNNRDIKKLHLPNWHKVKKLKVINGATSIGPSDLMLKWLQAIDFHLSNDYIGRYDQSVFNAYGYTFGFKNLSLHFGKIITLSKSHKLNMTKIGEIECISHPQFNPIIGIHHTTFQKELLRRFYLHCPRKNYTSKGYIAKLPNRDMDRLDKLIHGKETGY